MFLKSVVILLFGGVLSKSIGFILRIIISRSLGEYGMGIYSMITPTINLFSTLCIFSYPTSLSKTVSENNYSNKLLLFNTFIISIVINILLIAILIIFRGFITNVLLKREDLSIILVILCIYIPFMSMSAIIKGYFLGKQNMFPYMLSNTLEQITRFILILLFLDNVISYGIIYSICFILIVNIIGEIVSQIVMILFFPKDTLNFNNLCVSFSYIKRILNISIPSTLSKLLGSFCYFLEPIILTNILLFMGYSRNYIILEYGVLNGYVMSILLLPQIFIQNMSSALIPEISKYYYLNDYNRCILRIKQIIYTSLFIGVLCTLIINMFPSFILDFIYNTSSGIDYIRLFSPFIILYYIEYPLMNSLNSLNLSKYAFIVTSIGSVIRLLSIIIFSLLNMGMYSLVIAININLVISTLLYNHYVFKALKKKH